MPNLIKFKRGNKANLPSLAIGEPAFTLDEERLYVGGNNGNVELPIKKDIPKVPWLNVEDFGAIGEMVRTFGNITAGSNQLHVTNTDKFKVGCGILVTGAGTAPTTEAISLQITAVPARTGTLYVSLDGWIFTTSYAGGGIPINSTDTVIQVADKIRACAFPGWTVGGTPGTDTVTFTCQTPGGRRSLGLSDFDGINFDYNIVYSTKGSGDLLTKVTAIDTVNKIITLQNSAITTSSNATVYSDDTAAFNAAIAAMPSTGGTIYVPNQYQIAGTVKINKPGVKIFGDSINKSIIHSSVPVTRYSTMFLFEGDTLISMVGIGMKDITINMYSADMDAIVVSKGWGTIFENILINDCGMNSGGISFKKHPLANNGDEISVSQSISLINVESYRRLNCGTGIPFILNAVQEANLISCKAGGVSERGINAPTFLLESCRGISMYGCSSGGTRDSSIKIVSTYRLSHGINIIGHTHESVAGAELNIQGNSTLQIYDVRVLGQRREGALGDIYFTQARNCYVESRIQPVHIDNTCKDITIVTEDQSLITDAGLRTNIIGRAKTNADMTLYVSTTGNDSNDGLTGGTAFRTIAKAISVIPQTVNHTVTINVAAGTYNETVTIQGFNGSGTINLYGDTVVSTNYNVNNISVNKCTITVNVRGFNITSTTANGVSCTTCFRVSVGYCNIVATAMSNDAVSAYFANVHVHHTTTSNHAVGIDAQLCSMIFSEANTGTGNNYGLMSQGASTVGKSGTQPAGTTAENPITGGVIR